MAAALKIFFDILLSLGIGFSTGAIDQSVEDAINSGNIDYDHSQYTSLQEVNEILHPITSQLPEWILKSKVNADMCYDYVMTGNQGNVSASDLANAGVNPSQWMLDNQDNIKYTSDGSSFDIVGYKIRTFSFPSRSAAKAAGFPAMSYWGRDDVPYSGIGVYTPNGSAYYVTDTDSIGRPSDPGTLEYVSIKNIEYSHDNGDSRDVYCANVTVTYTKNGVTLTKDLASYFLLPKGLADSDIIGDVAAAAVGSAVIGAEIADLNPDGSVTVDGTDYPMNPDGSVTINNVNYYPQISLPAYNDEALQGLLRQILSKLNQLTFDDTAADEITAPEITYDGTMSELLYNSPKWAQVFPFCLPWDFVRGVKLLSANPVAPVFKIPFDIPQIGAFPGYHSEVVLDFSKYDKYFVVVRWFSTVFFVMSLIFITFKIVKGAR